MRSTRFRFVAFALLVAGLAALVTISPREAAAQKGLPAPGPGGDV